VFYQDFLLFPSIAREEFLYQAFSLLKFNNAILFKLETKATSNIQCSTLLTSQLETKFLISIQLLQASKQKNPNKVGNETKFKKFFLTLNLNSRPKTEFLIRNSLFSVRDKRTQGKSIHFPKKSRLNSRRLPRVPYQNISLHSSFKINNHKQK